MMLSLQSAQKLKNPWIWIGCFIGFIIIFLIILKTYIYAGRFLPIQWFTLLLGSIVMIIFLGLRLKGIPEIKEKELAEMYFSNSVNFISIVVGVFGIVFSILIGTLYANVVTSTLKEGNLSIIHALDAYEFQLMRESITVAIFAIIFILSTFFTFLIPCIEVIKSKCQEENEKKNKEKR